MAFKAGLLSSLLINLVIATPFEQYILAPTSRTLHPVSVHKINGSVTGANSVCGDSAGKATFENPSAVTYDFGKNIAGLVTLEIGNVDAGQHIGLTYSESSLWISGEGCDATADAGIDEALWFSPTKPGNYSVSREHDRGGFRYLSLIHNTTGSLEVQRVTVKYTPMPHYAEDQLRNYTGYFHCNDELLNRIWYAGAYTNQLCTIDPHYGDALVHLGVINSTEPGSTGPNTWWSNTTIANGTSVSVDGAKRDRLVWPGDMSIVIPAVAVSTFDMITIANSLDSLYNLQNKRTGQLPYAGVPFPSSYSATYHLYSLIGVADYFLYTNDMSYLKGKWDQWKHGLNFSLSFIDSSGMMNVTSSEDWLRFGMGGHNIEANSILHYTINQGIKLGEVLNEDSSLLDSWVHTAAGIKSSANRLLWDSTAGMYKDNETTTLMPQDGNCWAIVSNITDTDAKKSSISAGLAARWTKFGAPAVEAADAVSPFISSYELQAHLLAGNASAALDLMRLEWGFMLNDPRMTNSTFIEGYSSDGILHYAPYTNDPRVSHAHGWATGPTSTLVSLIAGIQLTSAGGKTWSISPTLGGLREVDTGFSTGLGMFVSQVNASDDGTITGMKIMTPSGTTGSVKVPGANGHLMGSDGTAVALMDGVADHVEGGTYTLVLTGDSTGGAATTSGASPAQTANGAETASISFLVVAAGAAAFLSWLAIDGL